MSALITSPRASRIGKPYSFDDIFSALSRHTNAQFETQSQPEPEQDIKPDSAIDLTPIAPLLEQIHSAAASGDMSNCKKLIAELSVESLGKERHQQLLGAIKHYDLERVEELSREWIMVANQA